MNFRHTLLQVFALASGLPGLMVSGLATPKDSCNVPYPTTLIHEFPNPTWLENIAVRHNGQILTTSISTSVLYQVDPSQEQQPIPVATVPRSDGLLGIAELEQDVFYVIAGNLSGVTNDALTFSSAVWRIDLRPFRTTQTGTVSRPANVSFVAALSGVLFANTATRLAPGDNKNLLISDSATGRVLRINVETGILETVIQDPSMAPSTGAGVAGIHVYRSDLFYTNFAARQFYKMPISTRDGTPTGPPASVYSGVNGDDFTLSLDGKKAWIATNPSNSLFEVDIVRGTGRIVAEGLNMTSAALGRTKKDSNSLYVVAGGGLTLPLNNPGIEGGSVKRVDLPRKL